MKNAPAALLAGRQHKTLAMTKRRAPRPFKEAQDSASAEEGARLLLAEVGRTVDVLRRHHAIEAITVVVVRDPILQRQTAVLVQHTDGLADMLGSSSSSSSSSSNLLVRPAQCACIYTSGHLISQALTCTHMQAQKQTEAEVPMQLSRQELAVRTLLCFPCIPVIGIAITVSVQQVCCQSSQ